MKDTKPNASRASQRVVAECIAVLHARRCLAWRMNPIAPPMVRNGQTIWRSNASGNTGMSDIMGVAGGSGRAMAVEVKTGTGKLSPAQALFLDDVARAGGWACVVQSAAHLAQTIEAVPPHATILSPFRMRDDQRTAMQAKALREQQRKALRKAQARAKRRAS